MVYEMADTTKVASLFAGWEETLIHSCLQQVMGKIYVTDAENSKTACAYVGCFAFYAGEVPDEELIRNKPDGFVIMIPQNNAWAKEIEKCFPDNKKSDSVCYKKQHKI